jgi:hypothetical protein
VAKFIQPIPRNRDPFETWHKNKLSLKVVLCF